MKAKLLHLWSLLLHFFASPNKGHFNPMKAIRERYKGKDSIPDQEDIQAMEARREAARRRYSEKLFSKYSGRRAFTKAPPIHY